MRLLWLGCLLAATACSHGPTPVRLVRLSTIEPVEHWSGGAGVVGDFPAHDIASWTSKPLRIDLAPWDWLFPDDPGMVPEGWGSVRAVVLPLPPALDGRERNPSDLTLLGTSGFIPPHRPSRAGGATPAGPSWAYFGGKLFLLGEDDDAATGPLHLEYLIDPGGVPLDPLEACRLAGEGLPARYRLGFGDADAVALGVPGVVRWRVALPPRATLRFGLCVEPPGLVVREDHLEHHGLPEARFDLIVRVDGNEVLHEAIRETPSKGGRGGPSRTAESPGAGRAIPASGPGPCSPTATTPAAAASDTASSGVRPFTVALPADLTPEGSAPAMVDLTFEAVDADPMLPDRVLLVDPRVELSPAAQDPREGIVLVVLDTLRRDRLGCYGAVRPTSPRLDGLASQGTLFREAHSTSDWTLPAHASLFLSRWPHEHRVWSLGDALRRPADTLASRLRDAGVVTAGFTDGGYLRASTGLDEGFAEWHDHPVGADGVFAAAASWLRHRGGARFFLFVHTYEVHAPYAPSPESLAAVAPDYRGASDSRALYPVRDPQALAGDPARIRDVVGHAIDVYGEAFDVLYDAGVRDADRAAGRLLDALEQESLEDRTLILVTSDHGEMLREHRLLGHGSGFWRQLLEVPLLARGPGFQSRAVRDEVRSLVDLAPTVLDWWSLPIPPAWVGHSLLRPDPATAAVAVDRNGRTGAMEFAVCDGRWKLVDFRRQGVLPSGEPGRRLFSLEGDPEEAADATAAHPEIASRLEAIAQAVLARKDPDGLAVRRGELTRQERRELESLGYLR